MTHTRDVRYDIFDNLMERHSKLIRKLCWRHSSGSEALCNELVQECYIYIWFHLQSLHRNATALQEKTWIAWQCRSVFSHRRRRRSRDWLPIDGYLADVLPDPTNSSVREQIAEMSIDLNESERCTLELMLKGYTVEETAIMQNIKPDSVKKQRQRIVRKMKQTYDNITHLSQVVK